MMNLSAPGAENQHGCLEIVSFCGFRSSHSSVADSYLPDPLTHIIVSKSPTDSLPVWYGYCV